MIERMRFFVASLWAALVPVAMYIMGCVSILMSPALSARTAVTGYAAWVALILVPFAYTGLVVASYCVARALYGVRVLSRLTLLGAYAVLSLLGALLFSWLSSIFEYATGSSALAFVLFLVLSLIGMEIAALVWWRTASDPPAPSAKEAARRERHRLVRERRRLELEKSHRMSETRESREEGEEQR